MSAFGNGPLGMPIGGGPLTPRSDDLPWHLDPPPEEALRVLRELLKPLMVAAPRPTLVFNSRSPSLAVERLSTLYSDIGNLRAYLCNSLGIQVGDKQLEDISASLRQGQQFLRVAATSDLMTLPLIAYYSFVAYGAAAILASPDQVTTLRQLSPGHGMQASRNFDTPLAELAVGVKGRKYLFQRLLDVFRQRSGIPIRARQGHAWVKVLSATPEELDGQQIRLQDLFSRILGIEDIFRATFHTRTASLKAQVWCSDPHTIPPRLTLIVYGENPSSLEQVYETMPLLREWLFVREWSTQDKLAFVNLPVDYSGHATDFEECQREFLPPEAVLVPLSRGPSGDWRLVNPIGKMFVPQPNLIFMASFLLSSIARYRPDLWSRTVTPSAGEGPGLRALIEEFYSLALERFPLDAMAAMLRVDLAVHHHGVEMMTS